jgi:hypothetical protein
MRFLLSSGNCGFVDVGRPLWREDGSVVYDCCWSSPAQSFFGPAELTTIVYCPLFETPANWGSGPRIYISQEQGGPVMLQTLGSLFVASYDSQGSGGGILTRFHTGWPPWTKLLSMAKSRSKLYYDRQSVLVSGTFYFLFIFRYLLVCWSGAPALMRGQVCITLFLCSFIFALVICCSDC